MWCCQDKPVNLPVWCSLQRAGVLTITGAEGKTDVDTRPSRLQDGHNLVSPLIIDDQQHLNNVRLHGWKGTDEGLHSGERKTVMTSADEQRPAL